VSQNTSADFVFIWDDGLFFVSACRFATAATTAASAIARPDGFPESFPA
jgi:hypothetical protein